MRFAKLKNIVEVKKGRKPSLVDTPDENSVRVLQIDDLRNDANPKFTNDKAGVLATEEDILIAWDGANAGTIGYGKSGYIGSTIALLRKKQPALYSTTFIGIFLQSQYQYLRTKTTGATIPHINRKALDELEIPVLTLSDQLHIANLLSKAESLIARRKESIRLLDEYLKSTFLEMFGDPARNERGWEVKKLGELFDKSSIVDGPFGSAINVKEDYVLDGEIPIIRTVNIKRFNFNKDDLKFIRKEKYDQIKRSNVQSGDIIISKVGTIGNVCLFPSDFVEAVLSTTGSTRIRNTNPEIATLFLLYYLDFYKPKIMKMVLTGVQPFLTLGHIKSFKIFIPPFKLQVKFAQIVEKTESLKSQYQNNLKELEQLYGSLSQRAFRGEMG